MGEQASPTEAADRSAWTPPLVRWALDALPPWLDPADRATIDGLRKRCDTRLLDLIDRRGRDDRVRAIGRLTSTAWHPEVRPRADLLKLRFLAEVTADELRELGRASLESAHLTLVEQEDLEPAARTQALLDERRNACEILDKVGGLLRADSLSEDQRRALRGQKKRLRAIARRLHDQADEATLARRLEGVFGKGGVALFSRLTLFLLLVLLALLVTDLFVPEESAFKAVLTWLDTGICGVFLWEFLWRFAFAPRRHSWFLRHLLTDFVPALPFALMLNVSTATSWIRSIRLIRFPLYARYVRLLKPLVAFFRLIVFWVRGMDRLVQSLGPFLNRKIVLFELEADRRPEPSAHRFREIGIEREVTAAFERLTPAMRRARAPALLRRLASETERLLAADIETFETELGAGERKLGEARVMRAEDLVDTLQALEAEDAQAALPPDALRSLARLLRLADIPPLRWLPVLGGLVRAGREATAGERIAQAGRVLGDYSAKLLGAVTAWADLAGVLTPTQILDRIATALMKSTQRPAVRLLLFGSFFVLVKLLFEALPAIQLDGLVHFLDRFVATPLLVLGTVCLVLLLLARWLKRLAGETSGRLLRSAEARYVNLLELVRRRSEEEDRSRMIQRLARVELRDRAELDIEITAAMDELRGRSRPRRGRDCAGPGARKLALLLLDYQDGAFLHKTDTKLAQQFLSHPDLWSLRHEHLQIPRHEARRLAKLDLDSGGLFSGPFLWFDLVTTALSVKVARLCATYNIHLIPLHELDAASDAERQRHAALLGGEGELGSEPRRGRPYRGAHFHILHFLDPDERWTNEIGQLYGPDVVERLRLDRARLLRQLFGTRSLHRLPEHRRSVNPYDFYQGRLGGGRILLLPLRMLVGWLKLMWMMLKLAMRSVREILDPRIQLGAQPVEAAPFVVAQRKIRRLKKPLLYAAIRLAAQLDPCYLGLQPDGSETGEPGLWESDLARAEPTPGEVERIRRIRSDAAARLLYLPLFLEASGVRELDAKERRRLACAFAMDERGIARNAAAEARARAWLYSAEQPDTGPSGDFPRRGRVHARVAKHGFRHLLDFVGAVSRRELRHLRRAFRRDLGDFRLVCQVFGEAAPMRPTAAAMRTAEDLLASPDAFLGRLETLQALVALAVEDMRHYEELVYELGGYGPSSVGSEETAPQADRRAATEAIP